MQTKFTIYWPSGTAEEREADLPATPTFFELEAVLQPIFGPGHWFEHVTVLKPGLKPGAEPIAADLFVDENGHSLGLPRNEAATQIYRANALRQKPKLDPESLAWIVGPAVLFERRVWF